MDTLDPSTESPTTTAVAKPKAAKPAPKPKPTPPNNMAGMAHEAQSTLTPTQKESLRLANLQSSLHRGIEHLRQAYGIDLTLLPSGAIAEKLVEMVKHDEAVRGR
jgi:hypothetical protein